MTANDPRPVLLMAHGAAESIEELPGYYTHVRGSPPPPTLLEELTERYRAIGGRSPLRALTSSLAGRLQHELDRRHEPGTYSVRFGFRHTPPYIDEEVGSLLKDGASELLAVVLAPHRSGFVDQGYRRPIDAALQSAGRSTPVRILAGWYLEPSFVALEADLLRETIARLSPGVSAGSRVLFTAHSLPVSRVAEGDPYREQLREGARVIADRAGLPSARYALAWQSAGRTNDRWLGPDLRDVLKEERARGTVAVVVCPHGFVCDHLEVLFDIDIEARQVADSLGLRFERTAMPNDLPRFAEVLADVVDRSERAHGR